jgi:hypothetical protein
MNVLHQMNKDCKIYAELLGDYQSISINNLMDGYCKALDEADDINQNCYLSALVLRFWYVINKLYLKCPNIGLDHADFFMWLVEAINYAAKYRAWQKGTITAQACINQCINTIRLQHYYEYNLDKHRANYNTMSANTPIGEDDQTIEDLLEAEPEFIHRGSLVDYVVQTYINSNQVIEAVIFDNIAYNDCNRVTKHNHKGIDSETGEEYKYNTYSHEFWEYRLIQALNDLPDNYTQKFMSRYTITPAKLDAAVEVIKKATNQKLYKYVREAIADAKAHKDLFVA